ncbi:GreA/GreB family elongation factor [Chloroflexota bacterium]
MNSMNLGLREAANRFLTSLPPAKREASQVEAYRFARWYGWGRFISELTAPEMANYAEHLSLSSSDCARRLELVRAFLVYAKKEGWTKTNLAVHLKAKKGNVKLPALSRRSSQEVLLTQEGYAELEAELAALQSKRPGIIDEMRRAAADKDFRENAPLEAAREQSGYLEGRIMELKEILSFAIVTEGKEMPAAGANIGDSVVLHDITSGEELRYKLVGSKEVDPLRCKISVTSPIGKAIISRSEGEIVEVQAPAGKLRYRIKTIER